MTHKTHTHKHTHTQTHTHTHTHIHTRNKMQFNELKSKTVLIARKRNSEDINIYLNNRRLEQVKEMKYLGIYFENRLQFSPAHRTHS